MGFFKKLGNGLKGVTKMVSMKNFKNLLAGDYQSVLKEGQDRVTNIVKNTVTDELKHVKIKKQPKSQRNLTMQNDAMDINMMAKQNPNIKEILTGALAGAMTGAGGVMAGGKDAQEVGADAANGVFVTWLKKHWLALVGGLAAGTLFVWGLIAMLRPKKKAGKLRG